MIRAFALSVLVVAGCTGGSISPLALGRVALPNWPWTFPSGCALSEAPPPSPGVVPCVITGHGVEGRLDGSAGCVWIVLDGGGERRDLRWPPGYSVQFNPLIVYDNNGAEIARGGEQVTADGSEPPSVSNPCGGRVTDIYAMHSKSAKP